MFTSLLLSTCLLPSVSAQAPLEPNAEFDAGNVELARFIDPETDILLEPEELEEKPGGWRVVDEEFLRMGLTGEAALLLGGEGEATVELELPAEGAHRLWVRSHGAANRGFSTWVGGEKSGVRFGDGKMTWDDGGKFELTGKTVEIRIGEAENNPYFDALLLTRNLDLEPGDLRPLRAWAGDERWARAGEPVGFTAVDSMGDIVAWRWEFGDGGEPRVDEHCGRTFEEPGDYEVTLTVTGRNGETHSHAVSAHVLPATDYTVRMIPLKRRGSARFGDLNGDGEVDFLVGDPYRTVDAYLHDGTLLWSYDSPPEFPTPIQRREHPMVIWDFDGDGAVDVAMWRHIDGEEWLCLCDGLTGEVRKKVPWPLEDSYINGRLAVGNLTGRDDRPTILMFSGQFSEGDTQQADAYDAELNRLWSYSDDGGDILGHFVYSADVLGDAREEVFVSSAMILADGTVGWERMDIRRDHADSIRLGDLDGDGKVEVAYCYSGDGVYVLDAATGETKWHVPSNHAQQIEIADVRPDVEGLEVIVGDRFYMPRLRAKLLIYDCRGELLSAVPEVAITGNPNLGVLEWDGKPGMEIAWANMVLNGRGEVVAVLPGHLHHAFDFAGDGKEEFLCTIRDEDGRLSLAAFGDKASDVTLPKRTGYETRRKAANHSHY